MIRLSFLLDDPAPAMSVGPAQMVTLIRGKICMGAASIVVATYSKAGFHLQGADAHTLLVEGPLHLALENGVGAAHADLGTHDNIVIGNGLVVAGGDIIARVRTERWTTLDSPHGMECLVIRAANPVASSR